jgi:lipopolysaccharide export system permease protein
MTKTLSGMLIRAVLPVLVVALLFFLTILQLVDLFENITRYIELEVSATEIARVQILFLPRSLHFALPMALLFAVSFSLGTLYSNNELIAVFGAGISLQRFVIPVLVLGLLASAGAFFLHEYVVIDTLVRKNQLQDQLLRISRSESRSNVTRLGAGARLVYHAQYYNDGNETLSNAVFVSRSGEGSIQRIVHAQSAQWTGNHWEARSARVFDRVIDDQGRAGFEEHYLESLALEEFALGPTAFRRTTKEIDEMRLEEARSYVEEQRDAGLPFRGELTDYYERFSFAFTPFVVVLIATAVGGRFRKNILLMSLLISLSVSVVYYVGQFLSGLLAQSGIVSPIIGAWFGVTLFVALGVSLLRMSRT